MCRHAPHFLTAKQVGFVVKLMFLLLIALALSYHFESLMVETHAHLMHTSWKRYLKRSNPHGRGNNNKKISQAMLLGCTVEPAPFHAPQRSVHVHYCESFSMLYLAMNPLVCLLIFISGMYDRPSEIYRRATRLEPHLPRIKAASIECVA